MFKNRFCYRISKEAKMAWNNKLNIPAEAYIQVSIDTEKEVPQELKDSMHLNAIKGIAQKLDIREEYLTPITTEEYDLNVEE